MWTQEKLTLLQSQIYKHNMIEDEEIISAMEKYGGSFVQKLAELYHRADHINQAKIKVTWANYWEDYRELIKKHN